MFLPVLLFSAGVVAAKSHQEAAIIPRQEIATATDGNLIGLLSPPNTAATIVPTDVIVPVVAADEIVPVVAADECANSGPQVTSCSLTQEEWQAFDIDGFLAQAITVNGPEPNFPFIFSIDQGGDVSGFDCALLDNSDDVCHHPLATVSDFRTDCIFAGLQGLQQGTHFCDRYISPKAAFVVENWLRFRKGLQTQALAISDAREAIRSSNFVKDITDGMAEEKGSILDVVFRIIITLPLQLLTSPVKVVKFALKRFDDLGKDLGVLAGPEDLIEQIQANEAINDEKERIRDQLDRQLDAIVVGERKRLQGLLDAVFRGPGEARQVSLDEARASAPFRSAMSGAFLASNPSREELAGAMKTGLENFVVTSIIQGMGYSLILDPTPLEDGVIAGGVAGTSCRGNKGIPFLLGQPCALFRRGEQFDSPKMQDSGVLERLINVKNMAANAQECSEGTLSPDEDGAGDLPKCTYNFKIITLS